MTTLIAERYIRSSRLKKDKQHYDETDIDVSELVLICTEPSNHQLAEKFHK